MIKCNVRVATNPKAICRWRGGGGGGGRYSLRITKVKINIWPKVRQRVKETAKKPRKMEKRWRIEVAVRLLFFSLLDCFCISCHYYFSP